MTEKVHSVWIFAPAFSHGVAIRMEQLGILETIPTDQSQYENHRWKVIDYERYTDFQAICTRIALSLQDRDRLTPQEYAQYLSREIDEQ